MTPTPEVRERIRRYLLGQLTDDAREQVEQDLLANEELFEELLVIEDEIIDEYLGGKLSRDERTSFERHFLATPERHQKLKFGRAFDRYLSSQPATASVRELKPARTSWAWAQAFLSSPVRIAVCALVVLGVALGVWRVLFHQSEVDKGLLALNAAYREQRPIEARISKLDYAPYSQTRGANEPERVDSLARNRAELILSNAVSEKPDAAAHHALGKVYLAKKQFNEAIKQFENALKTDPNNPEVQSDLGAALLEQANVLRNQNQDGQSLDTLARSLKHLDEALRLNPSLPEALFNKALCLQSLKANSQAGEAWKKYLERDSNSRWADEARHALRLLEENKGVATPPAEAVEHFLIAYKGGDDDRAWAVLSQTREMVTGRMISLQLIREFLKAGDEGRLEAAESKLAALVYAAKLEQERAGDRYFTDLASYYSAVTKAQRSLLLQAQAELTQGYEQYLRSGYKPALDHFRSAQRLFTRTHDVWEEKLASYWIANCEAQNDNLVESADQLMSLVDFSKGRNYGWLLSQALWLLASDRYLMGEYSRSIELDQQAIESAQKISDLYNQQKILTQLATKYRQLRRPEYALSYHYRSLNLVTTEFESPRQAWRTYTSVAQTFYALKNYNAAAVYQREALQLVLGGINDAGLLHSSYIQLAQIYGASHHYSEAQSAIDLSLRAAQSLNDDPVSRKLVAYSTLQLAHLKRQEGDLQQALSNYSHAIQLYDLMKFNLDKYDAHKGRLLCYLAAKDDAAIESELRVVLGIFEEHRERILEEQNRNDFFDAEQGVYDLAIDYELRKGHNERAFDYSETSRARSLLDALRSDRTRSPKNESERSFVQATQPQAFADLRDHIPPQIQILQYAVLQNSVVIWLISNSELRVFQKNISQIELTEAVSHYMNVLTRRQSSVNTELNREAIALHELLISPVDAELDRARPVWIIPDKILFQLSFGSLISARSEQYLLREFSLSFAPSLNVLARCSNSATRHLKAGDETLLSVGNPAFDHQAYPDLRDLPSANREVAGIDRVYSKAKSLTGSAATKDAVEKQLADADVVHFACHYVVNESDPMQSRLLLAPRTSKKDEDAGCTLTASEVFGLKLKRPRLMVLSACQTGGERYYGGEGVVGIARTFLASGVPLVIASQWAVDSDATADLMINFHRYRKQQRLTTVAALRQAQVDMIDGQDQRYRDPYFWAAFVPVGGYATF